MLPSSLGKPLKYKVSKNITRTPHLELAESSSSQGVSGKEQSVLLSRLPSSS